MKTANSTNRAALISSLLVGAGLALGGTAIAADNSILKAPPEIPAQTKGAPSVDPGMAVIPGKSETADSAFKKLDVGAKGYVTVDDIKGLDGFDSAFRAADTTRTGKLDLAQFTKAWTFYTGLAGPSGQKGKAGEAGQSKQKQR